MSLSKREKLLLRLLLDQQKYQPAAFFQKQLYVSPKTVYNDLTSLEEKIKETGAVITKLPRKGIRLEGTESAKQNARSLLVYEQLILDEYSPEYRRLFIFGNYFFSEKAMRYHEFAEYFFVSQQSIKNDVDDIVRFCQSKQITGKVTSHGLQLIADESVQQNAFKSFLEPYMETEGSQHTSIPSLFDDRIIDLTEHFIYGMIQQIGRQINNYFVESLSLSLQIFLSRLLLDHHIEKQEQLVFDELKRMKLYMIARSFAEMVNESLSISLQESDIQYICSLLLAHGIEPYVQSTDKPDSVITVSTKRIIDKMSTLLKIDLTQDELLLQALLSHIVPMIHRLKTGMLIKNPLLKSIKTQYSTMFTLTKYAISELEKEFRCSLTEDEVSFLTIHFQLAFEKRKMTNHILIVCRSGLATSELIFNRIKQTISANTVLEIIQSNKLSHTSLEMVDLIISTIPLEEVEPPVMYVSALPTTEEITNISARISNLNENEKKFHSKKYQSPTLLKKYLDPDFIYIQKPFSTKEAILSFLADDYFEKDLVSHGFKRSLFDREELGSTGLKTGVAIPHADPHTVKETKLAFVTLASPIVWGDTKIQLIVLLAIAEENMTEAKELIASIYDLFNSSEEIQWIVASQTPDELYHRLLRGGNELVF
ncbi:BglG family transcription antiterminator [Enterococcus mundtii]|uniref:Uncharacterized protein n=1 Tax=Enterococcus mundtii TaxID=53346 RepID=A0A2S7RNR6_ENTMU|nr:BglG family transcription antiterminator [Enterococcus mundtii]PQF20809.1 hypothetical protein CUS89_14375 [Enterococcus mundtii]